MTDFETLWTSIGQHDPADDASKTARIQVSRWVEVVDRGRIVARLGELAVDLDVRWVEDRFAPTAVRVLHAEDWSNAHLTDLNLYLSATRTLEPTALRRVPLETLVGKIAGILARPVVLEGDPPFSRDIESTLDMIKPAPPPARGQQLTSDQLVYAARIYELAAAMGRPSTSTLAERLGSSLSTASSWVAQARKAGLITFEPRSGRRGGIR